MYYSLEVGINCAFLLS